MHHAPRMACGSGLRTLQLASEDGTQLHGSLFEAAEPTAGLLLVHGLQSHAGWFEASGTPAQLAASGVTCVAFDRRGSGRSGGRRGHVSSPAEFLADLAAAAAALRATLERAGAAGAPLHVLANCFGTRIVLPWLAQHRGVFRSVILTAPGTHMRRRASYGLWQRVSILLSPAERYFPTPLRDDDFVRSGAWLEWIRADALALRRVTAGFLRSVAALTRPTRAAIAQLRLPLLVVLGCRDLLVDNQAIREHLVGPYQGPTEVVEYDADHYVDFTNARHALGRKLEEWIHVTAPRMGRP